MEDLIIVVTVTMAIIPGREPTTAEVTSTSHFKEQPEAVEVLRPVVLTTIDRRVVHPGAIIAAGIMRINSLRLMHPPGKRMEKSSVKSILGSRLTTRSINQVSLSVTTGQRISVKVLWVRIIFPSWFPRRFLIFFFLQAKRGMTKILI